jgi:chromate transporter
MNHPIKMHAYSKIFLIFFQLGCISFGGPAAHLVFFHKTFVKELKWLDEHEYSQLLALAQILPGPTSSQVGLAIGYVTRGYWGAICAWLGFTLPSAIVMTLVALLGIRLSPYLSSDFFHVIQLTVLAVVTWAFWQMLCSFCHQTWQYILMIGAASFIYFMQTSFSQMLVIVLAAFVGILGAKYLKFETKKPPQKIYQGPVSKLNKHAYIWLVLFALPFVLFPLITNIYPSLLIKSFEDFYHTASLVFGGGHIVLPLLHQNFVETGLISNENFDLGYAVAQLMPGPLFSFASYLGTLLAITDSVIFNSAIATLMIFMPSFFLIFGALPYWSWFIKQKKIYQAMAGINAAVVGILLCLVVQMTQRYIIQWSDVLFLILVIALLRTKVPVWLTLIGTFGAYYSILNLLV